MQFCGICGIWDDPSTPLTLVKTNKWEGKREKKLLRKLGFQNSIPPDGDVVVRFLFKFHSSYLRVSGVREGMFESSLTLCCESFFKLCKTLVYKDTSSPCRCLSFKWTHNARFVSVYFKQGICDSCFPVFLLSNRVMVMTMLTIKTMTYNSRRGSITYYT